jgi:AmmeMemoRadiSam system protein A
VRDPRDDAAGFGLSDDDRKRLLHLARASIREAIHGDGSLDEALEGLELTPGLRVKSGVFVTLKQPGAKGEPAEGRLRGCIGLMTSAEPLYRTVIGTAPKAALEDPRFPPLDAPELDGVRISLSILSPMRPLRELDDLVLGRHGLQLVSGAHRSVFLPQVPVEQRWDRARYLEQLALKAGLPRDGWRDGELRIFEAVAFGE